MVTGIDWRSLFEAVCRRGGVQLQWGLPEQWVHAELYAELWRRRGVLLWDPLPNEVPYVTWVPVRRPRGDAWTRDGAVKWVDLCLRSTRENAWCWVELKVRHAGDPTRHQEADRSALDAVKKDLAALVGFDPQRTARAWANPDVNTKAHWFRTLLGPHVDAVGGGRHMFVVAYLELLSSGMNGDLWDRKKVLHGVEASLQNRNREIDEPIVLPSDIKYSQTSGVGGEHTLVVWEWGLAQSSR